MSIYRYDGLPDLPSRTHPLRVIRSKRYRNNQFHVDAPVNAPGQRVLREDDFANSCHPDLRGSPLETDPARPRPPAAMPRAA